MSKILIIDDEPKSVKLLRQKLEQGSHVVTGAGSVTEAVNRISSELFDLLITDVRLPDGSGIELIGEANAIQPDLPIIVVTAYAEVRDAVRAMQLGAVEYVQKPFELEAMAILVSKTLETARLRGEHSYLLEQVLEGETEIEIIGRSVAMQRVRSLINRVAASSSTVLLTGESGTGKELAAQAIHAASGRQGRALIRVNCPAIPAQLFESELFGHMKGAFTGAVESRKGKFELAQDGTVFLDEISEIPFELQAKLLRVLEDRTFTRVGGSAEVRVEARVVAATNRELKEMVRDRRFREDLYYRLAVFPIHLPPLRARPEDIPDTALHLLTHVGPRCGLRPAGISDSAMDALGSYSWPGNVRELRNVLERSLVIAAGKMIETDHLPIEISECRPDREDRTYGFSARVEEYKVSLLVQALENAAWSKKDAAAALGLSQRAMSHYVARYDLDRYRKNGPPRRLMG
jgi:two-component system response regulator AtoC